MHNDRKTLNVFHGVVIERFWDKSSDETDGFFFKQNDTCGFSKRIVFENINIMNFKLD